MFIELPPCKHTLLLRPLAAAESESSVLMMVPFALKAEQVDFTWDEFTQPPFEIQSQQS